MEVYLIRHTRVGIEAGICYGQTDVPLADSFPIELEQVREKLPKIHDLTVYSSPLSRCRTLAEGLQLQGVEVDSRLMELNFGTWELQRWDDIGVGDLKAWTTDVVNQRCPDGESYQEQFQRAIAFWEDVAYKHEECVYVVTHGGFIRALLAYLLDIPLEKSLRLGVDFGGVTKIHFMQDVPIVDYINR